MKLVKLYGEEAIGEYEFAMVDDDDYDKVNLYKWYLEISYYRVDKGIRRKRKTPLIIIKAFVIDRTVKMHRFIKGYSDLPNIDHIDHNRFNNQKENLRFATISQNNKNKTSAFGSKSKYLGVTKDTSNTYWISSISLEGKTRYIAIFKTEEEAAFSYDTYALKYHGEFANLNFPGNIEEYKKLLDDIDIFKERTFSSSYNGVSYNKELSKWRAGITMNKKKFFIGDYITEIEAAEAYDIMLLKHGSSHNKINFPYKIDEYKTRFKEVEKIENMGTSGYRGVYPTKTNNKYTARVYQYNKPILLGTFDSSLDAAMAYDDYVIKNNIQNKKLNFPQEV